jgi:stearoyl-CoA desaturase (delta-9 desaturase)
LNQPSEVPSVRAPISWTNTTFLLGTLLVAVIGTPLYIWKVGLGWPETLTFLGLWLAVGLSITAGYHRLFAHKTYQASRPVRLLFLIFGAAALENTILKWAADHRVHHSHVDSERDPYNATRGFFWSHIGWIFFQNDPPSQTVVRDLSEDPLVRWQDRYYVTIGLTVALGIPLVVGLLTHRVLGCLLIGGVLRIVVSHHATFFINSLCHIIGRQPYSREHSARDSSIMAFLAFGEGYHNYHHSFPFDYRNGIRSWHFDPAKWMIWCLARVGLARDLRRASDVAVLKAKVRIQYDRAKERVEKAGEGFVEHSGRTLHEAYDAVEKAIHDLLAIERRGKVPTPLPGQEDLPVETLRGMIYRSLDEALDQWRVTLRQMRRLPVSAAA